MTLNVEGLCVEALAADMPLKERVEFVKRPSVESDRERPDHLAGQKSMERKREPVGCAVDDYVRSLHGTGAWTDETVQFFPYDCRAVPSFEKGGRDFRSTASGWGC